VRDVETFGGPFAFGGWEVREVGGKLFAGLLLLILLSTGCASPETSREPSPAATESAEKADVVSDDMVHPGETKDESGHPPASLPELISGEGEDDVLSVRLTAELEADQEHYKTSIVFANKTESSLNILYDCGLPVSDDRFAPEDGNCPAVESMYLRGNRKETLTVSLPAAFFQGDVSVRYRVNNRINELVIKVDRKF